MGGLRLSQSSRSVQERPRRPGWRSGSPGAMPVRTLASSSGSSSLIPPPPINTQQPGVATSLLYSGSKFRGHQKSKGNSYDVEVVLQVSRSGGEAMEGVCGGMVFKGKTGVIRPRMVRFWGAAVYVQMLGDQRQKYTGCWGAMGGEAMEGEGPWVER